MMAYVDEADGADRTEALLWAAPTGPLPAPPIDTKGQVLPIGDLHWPDVERLFLRLLHTVRPVQYAKLFGVPGQAQAGIDAYARLPLDLAYGETGGRDYITLQSRRVKSLTAARIKKAVDDLLKGEWAEKTAAFHFATSFDLQGTKFDAAIREQTDRLAKLGITYVPWGVQEVSTLLKDQPRIVDDFFGRAWVERFCGSEAAQAVANNLPHQDSRDLRAGLRDLYRAAFYAQGGVHSAENTEPAQQFVILDVDPNRQQPDILDTERPEATGEGQHPAQGPVDGHTYIASRLGARRQSFRSTRHLLHSTTRSTSATAGTVAADEWLAGGKYRLLVGRPGAGKSSLLRFAAMDRFSSTPQSIALQREQVDVIPRQRAQFLRPRANKQGHHDVCVQRTALGRVEYRLGLVQRQRLRGPTSLSLRHPAQAHHVPLDLVACHRALDGLGSGTPAVAGRCSYSTSWPWPPTIGRRPRR
jgi:hypothetical protein